MQDRNECERSGRIRAGTRSRQAGYSLLEILVVLAIMAVLAALVAPRFMGQLDRSKVTAAQTQVQALRSALDVMYLDLGRYPSAEEGLDLLVSPPSDSRLAARWFGPYIEGGLPVDPWGNDYVYEPPMTNLEGQRVPPIVLSLGADGERGGTGLDADISSARTVRDAGSQTG